MINVIFLLFWLAHARRLDGLVQIKKINNLHLDKLLFINYNTILIPLVIHE